MTAHPDSFRVHQLNLWFDPSSLTERLNSAAVEIHRRKPHVVTLQEVLHPGAGNDVAHRLAEATGMHVAISESHYRTRSGHRSGEAILTASPARAVGALHLPATPRDPGEGHHIAAWACLETPNGHPLHAISTHLAWGGNQEPHRAQQAHLVDQLARSLAHEHDHASPITVWGTDANTVPDSRTVRYLTGRDEVNGAGTNWTDLWSVVGAGAGATSTPENPWSATTAHGVDILNPDMLPRRRIDYVFAHYWLAGQPDWVIGRLGSPLAGRLAYLGDSDLPPASDHYGLEFDLWDPPPA